MFPYTPYYGRPDTFPNHLLFFTNLDQGEAVEVVLQGIMLNRENTDPSMTQVPNTHDHVTLQKKVLASFNFRMAKHAGCGFHCHPPLAQAFLSW